MTDLARTASAIAMFVSGAVLLLSAAYVRGRRGAIGRAGLATALVAAAAWSLAYGVELAVPTRQAKELWGALKYVGISVLPPAWLVFALQFTGRERRVRTRLLAALAVEPVIVLGALAIPDTRDLVRSYPPGPLDPVPIVELGPVFWALFAYSAVLVVLATGLIALRLVRISSAYRRQSFALLTAIALVWVANVLANVGVGFFRRVDPTPVALAVAGLILIWGVLRLGLLDLVPVARTMLVETMADAVLVLDAQHRVVDLNPAAQQVLGRPAAMAIGRRAEQLLGDQMPSPDSARGTHELVLDGNGGRHEYELVMSPLGDRSTVHAGHLLVLRDITERKQAERRLEHLAHHDLVTGLPNRKLFADRLEQALARARRSGVPVAVLFFDLDRFKVINDSLGHDIGDQVLAAVARRVEDCLRSEDTLARFGGDEFIVILPEIAHSQDAAVVAGKILRALSHPLRVDEHDLDMTASIGIAVWPEDGPDPQRLVHAADTAMYLAKSRGKNRFEFAGPDSARDTRATLELEWDLRRALKHHELFLEFQPLIALESGGLLGFEALVRWNHPRRGILPPAEFIPLAEEAGLIVAIDEWVLREACGHARQWRSVLDAAPVAVNLSPAQLVGDEFRTTVAEILHETSLEPATLVLEVNERAVVTEATPFAANLQKLKAMGVSLALDDFGAGRTSLGQLRQLPLDMIKIDREFIGHLGSGRGDSVIVSAIVSLAHALGMTVVAEGVEQPHQLETLRDLACDVGQGFLFAEPLPPAQALAPFAQ